MIVTIRVHTNSSQEKIIKINDVDNVYEVWLKEKAVDNKANLELIKVLKKYFKKDIKIKTGFTSKNKIIEVD